MFNNVLADVEEVFGSSAWTANSIKTVPDNFQGNLNNAKEYCMVMALPSSSEEVAYGVKKSLTGLVAVKIFTPVGFGQRRIMQIGDLLDDVLQYKTLTNGTTLKSSYINVEGIDPQNESFYMASYFIPFTQYGE